MEIHQKKIKNTQVDGDYVLISIRIKLVMDIFYPKFKKYVMVKKNVLYQHLKEFGIKSTIIVIVKKMII
jgi:hypothetical protein